MTEQSRKWTRGKWTHDVDLYLYAGPCQIGKVYLGENDEANAALIAEAGTVATETGLTPRQLAERVSDLEEVTRLLLELRHYTLNSEAHPMGELAIVERARAAIRTEPRT